MAALIIGTLLALVALAYVLYPLFVEPGSASAPARRVADERSARGGASDGAVPDDAVGVVGSAVPDDAVEAEIRRARRAIAACATCGPRPELDAVYCSNCGGYLAGRCGACAEPVTEPGARYCANCGHTLAA